MFLNFKPLKQPAFRKLYFSQLISFFGTQMTMVTIPFQVFAITGSTFQTGLVSAVELICLIVTVFWGGAVADRMDRRKIIIASEVLMTLLVGVLALNAFLDSPLLWLIYLLAGLLAGINGFHRPAFEALTPMLVAKEDLPSVSSLSTFRFVLGTLIGPALAGFLLSSLGPVFTYIIDLATFLVSLYLLMGITVSFQDDALEESTTGKASVIQEVIQGAQYLKSRRDILGSYVVDFCAMVFCMPHVLFPAFALFYGKTEWLGFLYFSTAAGGMFASLLSGWTLGVKRLGRAISIAAACWSLSVFTVGLIPSFWWIPIGLFFAGVSDGYSGIFRMTLWNESLPNQYRGRLASFGMLSYMSGPLLGNTIMGFVAGLVGLHNALAVGGGISLLTVIVTSLCLKEFWAYGSN